MMADEERTIQSDPEFEEQARRMVRESEAGRGGGEEPEGWSGVPSPVKPVPPRRTGSHARALPERETLEP